MKLLVILSSTRENRITERLSKWVFEELSGRSDIETELVDLKDYPMPFFDEPISPRFNPDRHIDPAAKLWLDKIASFDAYIFVTPEYNHSIPAVLKNALDYVTFELVKKPATIVGHGTVGGARAIMHLKEILSESRAAIIPTQLAFPGRVGETIDDQGRLNDKLTEQEHGPRALLKNLVEELKWYSDALAAARNIA